MDTDKPVKYELTETVKLSDPIKLEFDKIKTEGKHPTMDSVARELLAYRAAFLREHPEGLYIFKKKEIKHGD